MQDKARSSSLRFQEEVVEGRLEEDNLNLADLPRMHFYTTNSNPP